MPLIYCLGHNISAGSVTALQPRQLFSGPRKTQPVLSFTNACLFLKKIIYLFIYSCVGSSFLCEGFLQLWQVGATLHRGARASHYRGLSCCGAQAPDAQAQ